MSYWIHYCSEYHLEKETVVLAIPEMYTDKIITLYHKSLFTGHQGVIKKPT